MVIAHTKKAQSVLWEKENWQWHQWQLPSLSGSFVPPLPLVSCAARSQCPWWKDLKLLDCGKRFLPKMFLPLHLLSQTSSAGKDQSTSRRCKSQCLKDVCKSYGSSQDSPPCPTHTHSGREEASRLTVTWVKESGKNKTGLFRSLSPACSINLFTDF